MVIVLVVAVVVILLIAVVGIYNGLVVARQRVRNSWSQIEVELQRRFDLIPNLVEIVKGYAKHESEVLEKVTALRTKWSDASTVEQKEEVGNALTNTLKSVMAIAENYPDLKANQNFLSIQNDLNETESKIAHSRQFFNDAVTMYNTKLEVFPSNLIASMFNFVPEKLFETESDDAKKAVKVEF